jgi:hypothetical protein
MKTTFQQYGTNMNGIFLLSMPILYHSIVASYSPFLDLRE